MSNGTVCCLLGVCCPPNNPGARPKALAAEMEKHLDWNGTPPSSLAVAEMLLEHFDLVPKGLGEAIVEAYRPEFAKLATHP